MLLAVVGLLSSTVLAVFTDTATSTGNTFASGGVDIAASPATAAITLTNMVPGSRMTAPIDVSNSGSLDLRYAVQATTTEDTLASVLRLSVKSGVASCTSAGFDGGGTLIGGPGPVGTMIGLGLIGDSAVGADPGDRDLTSGSSEQLCLDVTFPRAAGNGSANSSTTATFTFLAEQTLVNP